MATLNAVVLPAKRLADGRNKVRISLAHNGETKYITTSIIIDSDKEFKNGSVVKRPDATFLNTKIRNLLNKYQSAIDEVEFIETYSCTELLDILKNGLQNERITFGQLYKIYVEKKKIKASSQNTYSILWNILSDTYIQTDFEVRKFSAETIASIDKKLSKTQYSLSFKHSIFSFIRGLTNFAVNNDMVTFSKNPWRNFTNYQTEIREAWISVETLKNFRDKEFRKKSHRHARDIFMLSFYLGGINLIDIASMDLNNILETGLISYIRSKSNRVFSNGKRIEFQAPSEALEVIEKLMNWKLFKNLTQANYLQILTPVGATLRDLREELGAKNLIFYSARKTFSQIALELGINTYVIDYILGHSVRNPIHDSRSCLYPYVRVTPEMATQAIRKVLDFIK